MEEESNHRVKVNWLTFLFGTLKTRYINPKKKKIKNNNSEKTNETCSTNKKNRTRGVLNLSSRCDSELNYLCGHSLRRMFIHLWHLPYCLANSLLSRSIMETVASVRCCHFRIWAHFRTIPTVTDQIVRLRINSCDSQMYRLLLLNRKLRNLHICQDWLLNRYSWIIADNWFRYWLIDLIRWHIMNCNCVQLNCNQSYTDV